MTDKELRRLHREDLLQILITQQRQIEDMTAALEDSEAALKDKRMAIEEAGSIAEAAMRVNGVFTAAQKAADRYMEEMRARADAMEAEAQQKAENIVKQARVEAARILNQAKREAGVPLKTAAPATVAPASRVRRDS